MLPKVGDVVSSSDVFVQEDFDNFTALSGDDNPIHVDPEFASNSRFGSTVAHGMLLYSRICGVLSVHFPGSAQIEQQLKFTAPTFAGEEVKTRIVVIKVEDGRRCVSLSILMTASEDKIVCDGTALLRWSER